MNGPDRLFQYAAQTTTTIATTATTGPEDVPRGRRRRERVDLSEKAARVRDTVGGYHADGEAGRWPRGDLPARITSRPDAAWVRHRGLAAQPYRLRQVSDNLEPSRIRPGGGYGTRLRRPGNLEQRGCRRVRVELNPLRGRVDRDLAGCGHLALTLPGATDLQVDDGK